MLRKRMRKPFYAFTVIATFILAACGKEFSGRQMSEQEAFGTIAKMPSDNATRGIRFKNSSNALTSNLQSLVSSGVVPLPSNNQIPSLSNGKLNLSTLTNMFSLIQGGQATNTSSLLTGLMGLAGGLGGSSSSLGSLGGLVGGLSGALGGSSGGSGASGLGGILGSLLPLIMTAAPMMAPQFAGPMMALQIILPLLTSMMGSSVGSQPPVKTGFSMILPRRSWA